MIYGAKLSAALLVSVMTCVWLIGCGPKPVTLIVEPPQPGDSIVIDEPDAAAEADRQNERSPVQIVEPSLDVSEPGPDDPSDRSTEGEEPSLVHKVRWQHETLYTIALWYTGNGNNWRRLAAANPEIKPRRMRIGTMIRIPGPLLTKRRPMPANYLRPAPARKSKPASQPPSKPVESIQPPPLYGPVERTPELYGPVGDAPQAQAEEERQPSVPLETIDE